MKLHLGLTAGLASASLAVWELALTRLASLLFFFEIAYAILALGLLALAAGALFSTRWLRDRDPPPHALRNLLIASPPAMIACLLPLLLTNLAWILALFTLPFFLFGATLPLLYRRAGPHRHLIYGAELLGAIAGFVLAGPLALSTLGATGSVLVAALLAALALPPLKAARPLMSTLAASALPLLLLLATLIRGQPLWDAPILDPSVGLETHMRQLVQREGLRSLQTHGSAYARTDLIQTEEAGVIYAFTDAMFVARSVTWDGSSPRFPSPHIESLATLKRLPLQLSRPERVLILGAGAGFDVAVALQEGARDVVAVEINPEMVRFAREQRHTNGDVYARDNVEVVVREARRFVDSDPSRYDQIQLTLMETSPAALRGSAAVHARIFTQEALHSYLAHLRPEGLLTVVQNDSVLADKTVALALSILPGRTPEAMQRIAVLSLSDDENPFSHLVLLTASPAWSPAQRAQIAELARDAGASVDWLPEHPTGKPHFQALGLGELSLDRWVEQSPLRLTPPTDEQPFFYTRSLRPPLHAMALLLILAIWTALRRVQASARTRWTRRGLALLLVGAASGLVQVGAFYRTQTAIGLPALSMGVALAGLLCGAAAGALAWRRLPSLLRSVTPASLLAALSCGVLAGTSWWWAQALQHLEPWEASAASGGLLVLHAAPMGLPFLALLDASANDDPEGEAHAVATDAVGMVVGVSLATWLALLLGYSGIFLIAALVMAAAAACTQD